MTKYHRVVIEQGKKKSFATAIDWPGWSRSGKSDEDAIDSLKRYADRYEVIAQAAGVRGVKATAESPEVVGTLQGSGATDFGIPDKIAKSDYEFMTDAECGRQLKLLRSCWTYFDKVAAKVSAEIQKGPRGGGRDRDGIVEHTLDADRGYARQIGVKTTPEEYKSASGIAEHRANVEAAIRDHNAAQTETRWPLRYFIRRAAWHLLDHAWEMEDKDLTAKRKETA